MGILDKKTRFIDLVITDEGKRQIASGKLRAEFASLSDCLAFYDAGELESVNDRIYFEAMHRPENSLVMEKDDSGKLIPFDFSPTGSILGNNVFIKNAEQTNFLELKAVTGSQFASTESDILATALKHFNANYFLGTNDIQDQNNFNVQPKDVVFKIDNAVPFKQGPYNQNINVDYAEPFFLDKRLTHLPNFQYLPPKNTDNSPFGKYKDIRNTTQETFTSIKNRLGYDIHREDKNNAKNYSNNLKENYFGNLGEESRKLLVDGELPLVPSDLKNLEVLHFVETSSDNNLVIQMFEDSEGSVMTKLDIIDAGVFYDDDKLAKPVRIFYLGKIYYDSYNTPTFINIFTLIME